MNTPVLKDLKGEDFTEGDRVVYASTNGIRVGTVEWIKPKHVRFAGKPVAGHDPEYRVYINLTEHHSLKGHGKMYAKKQGYDYAPQYFLKVNKL